MTGAPAIRKFILQILFVGAAVFALDRVLGLYLEREFYKQKHGDDQVTRYVLDSAKEEILVLGGSRASHHYIPDVLTAASGMSSYNGGRDNMDILYESAVLEQCLLRGYVPKVVVLDMTHLDLANYGSGRELNVQRTSTALIPFASRHHALYPTVALAGRFETLKAQLSHLYPYNSLFGTILQNTYTHYGHEAVSGYEPLYQKIDSAAYKAPIWGSKIPDDDIYQPSLERLERVITLAREQKIRLIGVFSPMYFPVEVQQPRSYKLLRQKLESAGFEWYDFSRHPEFSMKPELFNDDVHLNDAGARKFSRLFAETLATAPVAGQPNTDRMDGKD